MVVEGDEAHVEGGVVQAGEAEPVADVEPFFRLSAPGQDVGGDLCDLIPIAGAGFWR